MNVGPNMVSHMQTEADGWALYRVRSFAFRLHPQDNAASTAVCYVGSDQDTAPATVAAATETIFSTLLTKFQTVPSSWVVVPRKLLTGMFSWYRTIQGAEPANESSPGQVLVLGTGTDAFVLEFRGSIEFKQGLDPANTPEAIALYARIREIRKKAIVEKQRSALLLQLSPPTGQGKMTP